MTKLQMMEIARDFINLHNESIRKNWKVDTLTTYCKIESGLYGEVHEEDGNYQVEIGRLESKTGNPIIFEWNKE